MRISGPLLLQIIGVLFSAASLTAILWFNLSSISDQKTENVNNFRDKLESYVISAIDNGLSDTDARDLELILANGLRRHKDDMMDQDGWDELRTEFCSAVEASTCKTFSEPQYPDVLFSERPKLIEYCYGFFNSCNGCF